MDGAGWKLDAVGVCHRYLIQDPAVTCEPLERPASSGRVAGAGLGGLGLELGPQQVSDQSASSAAGAGI
jgi:hypothetical protein